MVSLLTEPLEMLQMPTDIRPCVNNLIVKYFKFVLKSKHQSSLARCLAIAILQNGEAGIVGRVGGQGDYSFVNLFERLSQVQRRGVQQGAVKILVAKI